MLFTEPVFLAFFFITFGVYWILPSNSSRKAWLFLTSCFFYGFWDIRFLGLIFISIAIDFVAGLLVGSGRPLAIRRFWLVISLCANLGILGFFKYFNFFIESAVAALQLAGMNPPSSTLSIILPVGVSFYTFQSMSYTIDVYRDDLKCVRSPLDFAFFVIFFPQLVAGPIVRAATFLPQLEVKRTFASVEFRACLLLFLMGFFKKACVADNLAPFVDRAFETPHLFTIAGLWFGAIGYAIQIYCDFSGYTDMAIATAGLLGYKFNENFHHPYFSSNITLFWRRWHMSLSTWLRDYLYIPLGGNRGSRLFAARNIMITMLLGGLWHGAGWNFILWGAIHGIALALDREFVQPKAKGTFSLTLMHGAGIAFTFFIVVNAWVLFRAPDMNSALRFFNYLYFPSASGIYAIPQYGLLILMILCLLHYLAYRFPPIIWLRSIPDWAFSILLALALLAILPWISTRYTPFIYFQF